MSGSTCNSPQSCCGDTPWRCAIDGPLNTPWFCHGDLDSPLQASKIGQPAYAATAWFKGCKSSRNFSMLFESCWGRHSSSVISVLLITVQPYLENWVKAFQTDLPQKSREELYKRLQIFYTSCRDRHDDTPGMTGNGFFVSGVSGVWITSISLFPNDDSARCPAWNRRSGQTAGQAVSDRRVVCSPKRWFPGLVFVCQPHATRDAREFVILKWKEGSVSH